jgi:uncharacterized membrane-anchored protein
MIVNRKWMWPLLGGVAFIQSAILFDMVYERDRLLKSGRELTLAVHPVDPRDFFRGDYVTLDYDISRLTKSNTESDPEFSGFVIGTAAYVTMAPNSEGGWAAKHIGSIYPSKVGPGEIVLKGKVLSTWPDQGGANSVATVRYGVEQYFVPEGTGRDIEGKIRDHKIEAIVAVGNDGTAVLKGLVIDGERHEDPPLL